MFYVINHILLLHGPLVSLGIPAATMRMEWWGFHSEAGPKRSKETKKILLWIKGIWKIQPTTLKLQPIPLNNTQVPFVLPPTTSISFWSGAASTPCLGPWSIMAAPPTQSWVRRPPVRWPPPSQQASHHFSFQVLPLAAKKWPCMCDYTTKQGNQRKTRWIYNGGAPKDLNVTQFYESETDFLSSDLSI